MSYGDTATFTCSGYGHIISWTVDNTNVASMGQAMAARRGISTNSSKIYYGGFYHIDSELLISGNCLNNLAAVQCTVYSCSNLSSATSTTRILRVESLHMSLLLKMHLFLMFCVGFILPVPSVSTNINTLSLMLGSRSIYSNQSYDVTIQDMQSENDTIQYRLFGNASFYKLRVEKPHACHTYLVSIELVYVERCTTANATSVNVIAVFDGKLASIAWYEHALHVCNHIGYPFIADKNTIKVAYTKEESIANVSFKV